MNNNTKKIVALLLAAVITLSFAACAKKDAGEKSSSISLGTSADYPPFEFIYLDDNGGKQYAGIDISLGQKIAEDMGKELNIVNMNFDSLIAALGKGEIDMVIAAMEIDEERTDAADASEAYYTALPDMILVKEENAGQYSSVDDFSGKSVGAQTGTTKADVVTDVLTGAKLVGLTSVTDLVNELVYDKCDAIVLDGAVALQYAASHDGLVVADVELGEAAPFVVWVQKGDPKGLLESINATIAKAAESGEIDKWIADADTLSDKAIEG